VLSRSNTQVSMWAKERGELIAYPRCHAPRRRGIQYAAAFESNDRRFGVLDHPLSRVMTKRVFDGSE
jgi:hypothetical protein